MEVPSVSQAGGDVYLPVPRHDAGPDEQPGGDIEWADLRSTVNRMRAHPVVVLALLMIVFQVIWKAQFLSHLYFRQDDFHDLDLAVEHAFNWSYLSYIGSGHLIIGLRAIAWVLVRVSGTYNWGLASLVSLVFVAAADLAGLKLLRDLFGERFAILIPLGIYLLTPLTMPDLGIWSSAMESVPLQLATFMTLSAHLRYLKSGRALHLAYAGFWLAFGLVFFEKGLVLPLLLFAITAAFLADRSLLRGLRSALLSHWRAWVVYAVLSGGYFAILIFALHTSATKPRIPISAAGSAHFVSRLIRDTLVPGAIGGPWRWYPVAGGSYAFAAPPHFLVTVASAVAVAVVVVSVLRRHIALRAWVLFAGYVVLADIVPVLIGRLNAQDAGILGLETRYVADAMPVLAVCIGLAFLPLAGQRAGLTTRVKLGPWSGQMSYSTVAILIGLYSLGAIWSVQAYLGVTTGKPVADYVANAEKAVSLVPRGTMMMNVAVPADMVVGLFGTYALQSKVIGDIDPGKLRWTQHPAGTIDGLRIFGPDGRLYMSYVKGARSVPLPPEDKCWPNHRGRIIIRFNQPSPAYTGILRIGYVWFPRRQATVVVKDGTNVRPLEVSRGLHSGYVPITGSIRRITVLSPSPGICIGDVEAGNLRPNPFATILP